MPWNDSFDATTVEPSQGFDTHPAGKFPAYISDTSIAPTKDGNGGLFKVTFCTPSGKIDRRYNLWNQSPQAVEIARKELSALCHATGIFQLNFNNDAAVLRNGRCMIEVDHQKDKEGKPTQYMEVKHVYDANGNEPGKGSAPAPQPQQAQQPLQQQPNGGWGQGSAGAAQAAPAPAPAPAAAAPPWSGAPNSPTPAAPPANKPSWG